MADDWDLSAVVRSCRGRTTGSSSTVGRNTESENPLACLASLTFEEADDSFSFPTLEQPVLYCFDSENKSISSCCELQNSCKPFLPSLELSRSAIDEPVGGSAGPGENSYGSHRQQQQLQSQENQRRQTLRLDREGFMLRSSVASSSTLCSPSGDAQSPGKEQKPALLPELLQVQHLEFPHQQQQQMLHRFPLRPLHPQLPRCRKRKNQQKRTVCHVTAENLSSDMWAWRKYGQKPIKGSPYPRNYYRCSSSKGCAARKQVERSNLDPNIFIVTYSGEHTHPRPTHRNSLAGSTRNKPSAAVQKPASSSDLAQSTANLSCSSPLSTNSLSPPSSAARRDSSPTTNGEEGNIEGDLEKESDELVGNEEDDDDDILIPNLTLNDQDDIFSGLHPVHHCGSFDGSCTAGVKRGPASDDNFTF